MNDDFKNIFGIEPGDPDSGDIVVGETVISEEKPSETPVKVDEDDKTATDKYFSEIFGDDEDDAPEREIENNEQEQEEEPEEEAAEDEIPDEDLEDEDIDEEDPKKARQKKLRDKRKLAEKRRREEEQRLQKLKAEEALRRRNDIFGSDEAKTPSKPPESGDISKDTLSDVGLPKTPETGEYSPLSTGYEATKDKTPENVPKQDNSVLANAAENALSEISVEETPVVSKSVSEMSDAELRSLTPTELSSLSPAEKAALYERFNDDRSLETKEYITGIVDIQEKDGVIEIKPKENVEATVSPSVSEEQKISEQSQKASPAEIPVERPAESTNTPSFSTEKQNVLETVGETSAQPVSGSSVSADTPVEVEKADVTPNYTPSSVESVINEVVKPGIKEEIGKSADVSEASRPVTSADVKPVSPNETNKTADVSETVDGFEINKPAETHKTDDITSPHFSSEMPNEDNTAPRYTSTEVQRTIDSVSDGMQPEKTPINSTERENSPVFSAEQRKTPVSEPVKKVETGFVYNGGSSSVETKRAFEQNAFVRELTANVGGAATVTVEDKGSSFTVISSVGEAKKEVYIVDKATGNVSGASAALVTVIGKTYDKFTKAPVTSPMQPERVIAEPVRKDSWSPDRVIQELKPTFGAVSYEKESNGDIRFNFPQKADTPSFTVTVNKERSPYSASVDNVASSTAAAAITRATDRIASEDAASYRLEKIAYKNAVDAAKGPRNAAPSFAYSPTFNGYAKKISTGNNIPLSESTTSGFFAGPRMASIYNGETVLDNSFLPNVRQNKDRLSAVSTESPLGQSGKVNNFLADFNAFRQQTGRGGVISEADIVAFNTAKFGYMPNIKGGNINTNTDFSPQAGMNINTFGSALSPRYDLNVFSEYNFLSNTKKLVKRGSKMAMRPMLNTLRMTYNSSEIGEGSQFISGYLGAPFMVGAAAATNYLATNKTGEFLLKSLSAEDRERINVTLQSAGISFKRNLAFDKMEDIQKLRKELTRAGDKFGISHLGSMNSTQLRALRNRILSAAPSYEGQKLTIEKAKALVERLGTTCPEEIALWVEKYNLVDSALSVAEMIEAAEHKFLSMFENLGLVKVGEKFDLNNIRDLGILMTRLDAYAKLNGFSIASDTSIAQLDKIIKSSGNVVEKSVAEMFKSLQRLQKRASRVASMRGRRFFSILSTLRMVSGQNDVITGALTYYRTINSVKLALKASIRLIKTTKTFLANTAARISRRVAASPLNVPAQALKNVYAGVRKTVAATKPVSAVRTSRTVKTLKTAKAAVGKTIKTTTKTVTVASEKIAATKAAATAAFKATSVGQFFAKAGAVLGEIFLGAVLGIVILVGICAALSLVFNLISSIGNTISVALDESIFTATNKPFEEIVADTYTELYEKDEAFYKDFVSAGASDVKDAINGYVNLNSFNKTKKTFGLSALKTPGDKSVCDGISNAEQLETAKTKNANYRGYEYHLYEGLITPLDESNGFTGLKEIPFTTNAKQIMACGNIVAYTDDPFSNKVEVRKLRNGSYTKVSSASLFKDYCYGSSNLFGNTNLWAATHGYTVTQSDVYACAKGCDTYTYGCNQYTAKTNSSDYSSVTKTENAENIAFYNIRNNSNVRLKGTVADQTYYGCKTHTTYGSSTVNHTFYCGLYHLDESTGNMVLCCEANSSVPTVGHTQKVPKLSGCNEQKWKDVLRTVSVPSQEQTKPIAKYCPTSFEGGGFSVESLNGKNNISLNIGSITALSSGSYKSLSLSEKKTYNNAFNEAKSALGNCNNVCVSVQYIGEINGQKLYYYAFYCGGHSHCKHGDSLYAKQQVPIYDDLNNNGKFDDGEPKFIDATVLDYCKSCHKDITVQATCYQKEFRCVGYCDGNHKVNYCKGHFNNIVSGYITTSMDADVKCKCYNCSETFVSSTGICPYCKAEDCYEEPRYPLTNSSKLEYTVFMADEMTVTRADGDAGYGGPSSHNGVVRWGSILTTDETPYKKYSSCGWFDSRLGPQRRMWAATKANQDWYYYYGIESADNSSGVALSRQEKQSLVTNATALLTANGVSESVKKSRLAVLDYALNSVGKIPYRYNGSASTKGYDNNNFGCKLNVADISGSFISGLGDVGWLRWTFASANAGNYSNSALCNLGTTLPGGSVAFDKNAVKPGDIVHFTSSVTVGNTDRWGKTSTETVHRYGIFIGWTDDNKTKAYVIGECPDPVNNVSVFVYDKSVFEDYRVWFTS